MRPLPLESIYPHLDRAETTARIDQHLQAQRALRARRPDAWRSRLARFLRRAADRFESPAARVRQRT